MKILELFSGTASFSKIAKERGHECLTLDNDPKFNPDYCTDIMDFNPSVLPWRPDIIWASPPCQCFSVMTISRNWEKKPFHSPIPKRDQTKVSIDLVKRTQELIRQLRPTYYFIENPMGMLRKMPFMNGWQKSSVTYCQYGFDYRKATDIWNNCFEWRPRPVCNVKSPCHQSATRSSHKGLQAVGRLKHRLNQHDMKAGHPALQRSIVPPALCLEIIEACEEARL